MKRLIAVAVSLLLTALLSGNAVGAENRVKYQTLSPHVWVDGSEPDMPVWDDKAQGFRPQKADKRKQVVIDERFVVPKGKTKTFKNKIVWMRPKTNKTDSLDVYGKLRFIDCLILWDQKSQQQNRLRIKKGGSLYIKNSYAMLANGFWANWEFEDGSKVDFNRYRGQMWTSIHGSVRYTAKNFSTAFLTFLSDTKNSRVVILNAHSVWFEIFPPEGSKFTISFPKKKKWQNWSLKNIWPRTTVVVRNSYIYARDLSLTNNVHATIRNTLDGTGVGWTVYSNDPDKPVKCTIRNLGNPNKRGTYYRKKVWRLPCNNSSLTLIKTKLISAWPNIYGYGTLKVYKSFLNDMFNHGGSCDDPPKLEIYNSTLFFAKAKKCSRIYLHNVKVSASTDETGAEKTSGMGIFPSDNSIIYGYKVRSAKPSGKFEITKTNGGKYIKLTSPGPPW